MSSNQEPALPTKPAKMEHDKRHAPSPGTLAPGTVRIFIRHSKGVGYIIGRGASVGKHARSPPLPPYLFFTSLSARRTDFFRQMAEKRYGECRW
jgi:hypothetical protein